MIPIRLQRHWRHHRAIARCVASGAAVGLLFGMFAVTSPAQAVAPGPGGVLTRTWPGGWPHLSPSDPDRRRLTPSQVRAQVAAAAVLEASLSLSNAELVAAQARLARLAARSSALLSAVAVARAAEQAAQPEESRHQATLAELTRQVTRARGDIQRMAYDAYVHGPGVLGGMASVLDVAAGDRQPAEAALVDYLAESRAADGRAYTALAQREQVAVDKAVAARQARRAASVKAVAAQVQAARSVADQAAALAARQQAMQADLQRLGQLTGTDGQTGPQLGIDDSLLRAVATGPRCSNDVGNHTRTAGWAPRSCVLSTVPQDN
ncbi:MAG TPA: hypothetical protein VES01_08730 [Dermatophilaceae bacterium]|nr:hypothetical protein [Dermatophilaceae bacterium]